MIDPALATILASVFNFIISMASYPICAGILMMGLYRSIDATVEFNMAFAYFSYAKAGSIILKKPITKIVPKLIAASARKMISTATKTGPLKPEVRPQASLNTSARLTYIVLKL
jgi:hypothetical protein